MRPHSMWLIVAAFLFALLPIRAQETRSTILGRITDPTGAVITGAAVAATYRDHGWHDRVWVWHEAADVRLFRLKHASATRIVPLLQSVFAEGPPVPGTEGLATQVSRLRTLKDGDPGKQNATPKTRAAVAT